MRAEHPSQDSAAFALGISRSTLQNRLIQAARRGLDGGVPKPISQGQVIQGTSTLYDADGNTVLQWIKTKDDKSFEDVTDALKTAFDKYTGFAKLPPAPTYTDDNLATVYVVSDHHLGLYAWAQECGADYDLSIGEASLKEAMAQLVSLSPPSATAVVLNLGDFFHSDTTENRTARSGNALDVDTRYAKVLQIGVELMIQCIQLALQKHASVIVRCLPGNHDPHTALALSVALKAFFASDGRVTVDCDPSKFFWWAFGKVFIGSTHGDMVKPQDMPGVMASYKPKEWGEAAYRYAYFGHVHHRSKGGGEQHGVVWETFQTLAAKDAWHASSGYSSGRSMTAITHHCDFGEVSRNTVSIKAVEHPCVASTQDARKSRVKDS